MKKVHHTTVALIPPTGEVFESLMKTRLALDDKGYYRWPPHVNLLYPYIENKEHQFLESAEALALALSEMPPFDVELSKFDVFGGRKRGVLWLKPTVIADGEEGEDKMKLLQAACESAVPICSDQRLKGQEKGYIAHMTITHYESIDKAREVAVQLEKNWTPLRFTVTEICMMERKGADGQFKIVYRIPLSSGNGKPIKEEPEGRRIEGMPEKQPQWIIEAKEKEREIKKKGNGHKRGSSSRRASSPRLPDSPEVIRQKRRERKLKRKGMATEENNKLTIKDANNCENANDSDEFGNGDYKESTVLGNNQANANAKDENEKYRRWLETFGSLL